MSWRANARASAAAMKCRICKSATLPGARLCGPCRAALNRARHGGDGATVASEGATRAGEVRPRSAAADSPAQADVQAAPKLRRWPAVIMTASVVAAALTYAWLGSGVQSRPSTATAAPAAGPVVASAGLPDPAESGPAEVRQAADTGTAVASAEPTTYPNDRELTGSRRDTASRKSPVRRQPANAREGPDVVAETAGGGNERVATADTVAVNTPAPLQAVVASPADRWRALDEALAKCGGNFVERIICGQHARFRYCDGYWGRVPQCPSGAVADNQ
jgi:hypothetical protein